MVSSQNRRKTKTRNHAELFNAFKYMNNKTKNLIIILIGLGIFLPILSLAYSVPTIDFKANELGSPVTISYNTSATLTWTSTNADYCYASGDWSGTKSLSGTESTGNLTSSKTYVITCTGPGGDRKSVV